ncbi:TIGR03086 family metal-binding protein [Streptomyces sp. NBC_00344]|uniref:TIGR03086 family metal-binding protein n=1 Tax=Streptomyces sp. NBC_00344 TaxID=2975720 RepID=UPI002E1AE082
MKNVYPHMIECAAEAARVAGGVTSGQLSGPTPCGQWDTRTLVNHWVLYTSHGLEHRARRRPLTGELTDRDFAAEPDWAARYAARLDRAVGAWSDPAVWEGEIDLGAGSMPAAGIAAMITKEMAVHGWDVAKATGQEIRVPDATGTLILGVVEEYAEIYRQYEGFADPVELSGPSTDFERALALSGRDPRWMP